MSVPVTVLMPIGSKPGHVQWLGEALESVFNQTYPVKEILFIDDQAHLNAQWVWNTFDRFPEPLKYVDDRKIDVPFHMRRWMWDKPPIEREMVINIWDTPWLLGFTAGFNCGMGLAMNDCVVYLASDDKLYPDAVADCVETYERNNRADAWYAMTYETDKGDVSDIPINAAMVTKGLWKFTGGFPPSAFAGPDALLLSCLMVHAPEKIIKVKPGKPNYWIRSHPDQDTHHQASFFLDEMNSIRNKETSRFRPNPEWAR